MHRHYEIICLNGNIKLGYDVALHNTNECVIIKTMCV